MRLLLEDINQMFKKSKWELWYDAQPDHIKRWMDQDHAIWHDRDMWKAGVTGLIIGLIIGVIL